MNVLDGKGLATQIKAEIALKVEAMVAQGKRRPHLAAVLVGDDPASHVYVRNKVRSCEKSGFESTLVRLPNTVTQQELMQKIHELNADDTIDGFIVQLPLPKHIDDEAVTLAIDYRKDVDGFHPMNFGRMALGLSCYVPATPLGIITMLERYGVETSGKSCAVIGRSNIVGTPISILLSRKALVGNATVTLVHSRSKGAAEILKQSDIIIAAIGIPHYLTADLVKEGAVVIDVGINRVEDPAAKRGYRLVGDVDYGAVAPKCSYITPVPGGVGPMTVTALLMNTLKAATHEIYK